MPAPRNVGKPHSRARRGSVDARVALVELPATGCTLPVPPLPAGREWTKTQRARWRELWRSPQANQWDETARGTAALRGGDPGRRGIGVAGAGGPPRRRSPRTDAEVAGRSGLADRRMTARRAARARSSLPGMVNGAGGVPRCLLVGRCIEVWADDPGAEGSHVSAVRRFNRARDYWFELADVPRAERHRLTPGGAPWSAAYLIGQGRSEVAARYLSRAGATVADLAALRREAGELFGVARNFQRRTIRAAGSAADRSP